MAGAASELFFGGIEGGGTGSTTIILSKEGKILSRSTGLDTNHWVIGLDECLQRVNAMVEEAKKAAGIDINKPLASLGLSLSGLERQETQQKAVSIMMSQYPNCSNKYHMCCDTVGALATSSNEGGIVLISGTGSNCQMLTPSGKTVNCGGWGHMLGDEGSAYWLSYRAIKTVFDAEDGLVPSPYDVTYVKKRVFEHFKIDNLFGMLDYLYASKFDKAYFAGLCKALALGAAEDKDPLCINLFYQAGEVLGRHVTAVVQHMDDECQELLLNGKEGLRITCVGAVWRSWDLLRDGFIAGIKGSSSNTAVQVKRFSLVTLRESSAVGAAALGAKCVHYSLPIDFDSMVDEFFRYEFQ
ncbi:N-acetyl-D-glucosamine kinase [Acropora cervicornis]|uniref:N-acetyl-D-glucosamine kinase n=1 Tax=Acropora cervicornis TaxID=6130 RepID=A0AAD9VFV4_ACRCE|nr:N-acetyl-D-glucosamine kinase [Acropora cervicornis]